MTEVRRRSHLERTLFKFLRSEQPQNQANKKRSERIVNPLHNHKITAAELVFYFFVGRGEVGGGVLMKGAKIKGALALLRLKSHLSFVLNFLSFKITMPDY